MSKILLLLSLFFCSNLSTAWTLLGTSSDGRNYWYDDKQVIKENENILLWIKFNITSKSVYSYKSYKSYLKLNCLDFSFETISENFYRDKYWYNQFRTTKTPSKRSFIEPFSIMEQLAEKICNL